MQRRYGFAAGFCRRPCRPLSPDMKSYWVTGKKMCKNTRSCAAFLRGHGFWRRNSKAGHDAGAFFCEKPPRTRFSERTAVPPPTLFPGGVTCVVFRANCPIADTTPVRLACDMSCGRKAKAACVSGRFAGKPSAHKILWENRCAPPRRRGALRGTLCKRPLPTADGEITVSRWPARVRCRKCAGMSAYLPVRKSGFALPFMVG